MPSAPPSNRNKRPLAEVPSLPDSAQEGQKSGWGFLGMFSGIKIGGRASGKGNASATDTSQQWESGEVHIDFVKVGIRPGPLQ